jgi:HEAT repeat protein
MQINTQWRPDLPSLVLGLVLGLALAYLLVRLLPRLRQQVRRGRGWAEGKISWMRSGVEVRFLAETAEYTQKHHLGADWATLHQVFILPQLTAPLEDDTILQEQRGAVQMAYLWPELAGRAGVPILPAVSVKQLLSNGRRVIISGAAGSGKTTLLAYLAWWLATGADKSFADTVPIFLHLAEIDWQKVTAEDGTTPDPITPFANALQKRSSPITGPGIGDMLRRRAAAGQVILLLDGWAELPVEQRPFTLAGLRALLSAHHKLPIFVTAAPEGYGDLLSLGFTHSQLQPWRIGQVQAFIAGWSKVLALPVSPTLETVWQPGQTPLETSLRFWLAAFSGGEVPKRQMEMLGTAVSLFLPRKKGELLKLPDPDALAFWEDIAFLIMDNGLLALPGERVIALATARATSGTAEPDKGQITRLRKSVAQNRLFVRWGSGAVGLRCTAFRDYLTAAYLINTGSENKVAAQLTNSKWQGVWPAYAALADPAALAAQLLPTADADPARDALFQIASWLPHTAATGNWRRQVMIQLGQLVRQPETPDVLRLRAIVAMAGTGEDGLFTFVSQLLSRPDPFSRQMGTAVLPLMPDDKVIGLLAERLNDEDLVVRLTAVYSLALLQHNPLTERPLVSALIGDQEEVGLLTAELLAANGGPGLEILQEAVKEDDIQVRRAAVHGLALVDEAWVEPLLANLERNDGEWFVRSAASGALDIIRRNRQPQPWLPLKAAAQPWLQNIALSQGKQAPSGGAAVSYVTTLFNEATDPATRVAAARLLTQLPAKEAIPSLQKAVEDGDTAVRDAAFKAWCALHRVYNQ